MSIHKRCRVVAAAALALLVPVGVSAQNLITNGDFEGTWQSVPQPITNWIGSGWAYFSLPLDATPNSASGHPAFWSMPGNEGSPIAGVNQYQRIIGGAIRVSNFRGGMYKVINTTPGTSYDWDFDARAFRTDINNSAVPMAAQYGYDLTGQTADPLASTVFWNDIPENEAWGRHSLRFTANSGSVSIFYKAQIAEATATVQFDVDNVSVVASNQTRIQITHGPTATQLSDTTFQIYWTTNIASTSAVEYDTTSPISDQGIAYSGLASNNTLTTEHTVLVTGLTVDQLYNYRVRSTANGAKTAYSLNNTFRTPPPPVAQFTNGSFETIIGDGPSRMAPPWRSFPAVGGGTGGDLSGIAGPYYPNRWYQGIRAQNGQYFAVAVSSWDRKQGGFYQRVQAQPGMTYTATTYRATYAGGGSPWDDQVWIGIDPKGGIDPGPEPDPNVTGPPPAPWIVWSTDGNQHSPNNTQPPEWGQTSVSAVAQANVITVFIRFQQKWPIEWNITAADNVTLQGPPAEAIPVAGVGEAKALGDNSFVEFTQPKVVTLVPQSETGFFYMQDLDGTSGIRVESGTNVQIGETVNVKGILMTNPNGERVLRDTTVSVAGVGNAIPRTTTMRYSGGVGYTDRSGNQLEYGVNTTGLLLRMTGRVTKVDYVNDYFLFDDGSGIWSGDPETDPSTGEQYRGVKVTNSGFLPIQGDMVTVTGVLVPQMVDGKKIRVLRGRNGLFPNDFITH